jgi:hypothetical protein
MRFTNRRQVAWCMSPQSCGRAFKILLVVSFHSCEQLVGQRSRPLKMSNKGQLVQSADGTKIFAQAVGDSAKPTVLLFMASLVPASQSRNSSPIWRFWKVCFWFDMMFIVMGGASSRLRRMTIRAHDTPRISRLWLIRSGWGSRLLQGVCRPFRFSCSTKILMDENRSLGGMSFFLGGEHKQTTQRNHRNRCNIKVWNEYHRRKHPPR